MAGLGAVGFLLPRTMVCGACGVGRVGAGPLTRPIGECGCVAVHRMTSYPATHIAVH